MHKHILENCAEALHNMSQHIQVILNYILLLEG